MCQLVCMNGGMCVFRIDTVMPAKRVMSTVGLVWVALL